MMDKLGFDFLHGLRNLRHIREADIIWTVLEWEWLAVSLIQRLGLAPKRPVIANSVWLVDRWNSWGRKRKWPYMWLMSNKNLYLSLHSKAALAEAREAIPNLGFHFLPFGISSLAFPVKEPKQWQAVDRKIRIYAIGNDGTRDWNTLVTAFGNDPRFEVNIVCEWLSDHISLGNYDNVSNPVGQRYQRSKEFLPVGRCSCGAHG